MFVGIDVARPNSRSDDLADLGGRFVINCQIATQQSSCQIGQGGRHRASGFRHTFALHEHQVDANIQRRRLPGAGYRVFEGIAIRHQSSRGEYTMLVRFHDSFIHVAGETKIVGVEDEPSQGQNKVSRMVRNFFGFAWKSFSTLVISFEVVVSES